ncbi:MAG TPA: alkaline phosphatase family protein [Bryobacteraceae bacterium]|jgi:phosphonoacetate hydrolase|nr:alkaline phosphatase family protein [Bryobacteraceae bacterium]
MTRRHLLLGMPAFLQNRRQRIIILMVDGLGADYIAASRMPVLTAWQRKGISKIVNGVMPSVTNANNTSICCGVWPETHGITANFYLDEATGRPEYMESASLVLAPTLFEKARAAGVTSALLSSKKKTVSLLPRGASLVLSAEIPAPEWLERIGKAPDIYSGEINHWLLRAAAWILRHQPDVGVLYIHTTDYPMHMWPPEAEPSQRHLAAFDSLLGELATAAPDAAILLTADHGMHHKSRCWDLTKACAARGVALRAAISAEQDKYLKHHSGYGGTAWVYLQSNRDADRAAAVIQKLAGVDEVLTRSEAARRFRLMPARIGELVVLGNRDTVFGNLDSESVDLPAAYRSHGSIAEARVPLLIHNAAKAPSAEFFENNLDLARWLFPTRNTAL